MTILAADVGGTHARLALFRAGARRPEKILERRWRSEDLDGLLPIVQAFLEDAHALPTRACLAVAGPVERGVSHLPNLGWELRQSELAKQLGIPDLVLLNDFDAVGHGVLLLDDQEMAVVQDGVPEDGAPLGLLGAGTGLGVAWVEPTRPPRVHSSEGGHTGFAPRNDAEWGLARFLTRRHGRASWERVLSGEGLLDVYRYLRDEGHITETARIRQEMEERDPHVVITKYAGDDDLCGRALELFVSAYGSMAANVALMFGARGGVFLAGGIAPAIVEALRAGPFLDAFRDVGRMEEYIADIPVRVILARDVGLLGAASVAARLDGQEAP